MSINQPSAKQHSFEEIQFFVNKISCDTDLLLGRLFKILGPPSINDSVGNISLSSGVLTHLKLNVSSKSNFLKRKEDQPEINNASEPEALCIVKNLLQNNQLLKDHIFNLLNELQLTKCQNLGLKQKFLEGQSINLERIDAPQYTLPLGQSITVENVKNTNSVDFDGLTNFSASHEPNTYVTRTPSQQFLYDGLQSVTNNTGAAQPLCEYPLPFNKVHNKIKDENSKDSGLDNGFHYFKEQSTIATILPPLELPKFDIDYLS